MTDCNIELNFFELNDLETLKRLVDLKNNSLTTNELKWVPGLSGISHGGFIKKQSDTNYKGYILPKIRKLRFKKTDKKGSYNDEENYSIPGTFALKGDGQILRFLRVNKSNKNELLLEFKLCESNINDDEDLSKNTIVSEDELDDDNNVDSESDESESESEDDDDDNDDEEDLHNQQEPLSEMRKMQPNNIAEKVNEGIKKQNEVKVNNVPPPQANNGAPPKANNGVPPQANNGAPPQANNGAPPQANNGANNEENKKEEAQIGGLMSTFKKNFNSMLGIKSQGGGASKIIEAATKLQNLTKNMEDGKDLNQPNKQANEVVQDNNNYNMNSDESQSSNQTINPAVEELDPNLENNVANNVNAEAVNNQAVNNQAVNTNVNAEAVNNPVANTPVANTQAVNNQAVNTQAVNNQALNTQAVNNQAVNTQAVNTPVANNVNTPAANTQAVNNAEAVQETTKTEGKIFPISNLANSNMLNTLKQSFNNAFRTEEIAKKDKEQAEADLEAYKEQKQEYNTKLKEEENNLEPKNSDEQMISIKKELSEVKKLITNFREAICKPRVSDEELNKELESTEVQESNATNQSLLQLGGSRSHKKKRLRNRSKLRRKRAYVR